MSNMATPSSSDSHALDRQLLGSIAVLIAMAAALLIGGIIVWRVVIVPIEPTLQSAGQATNTVDSLLGAGSGLLLFLLLVSAILLFAGGGWRGAFIDAITVFFAFSFLAVAGDALIWVEGFIGHLSGDLLSSVSQQQASRADSVSTVAIVFAVLHISAACLGIAARKSARDGAPALTSLTVATPAAMCAPGSQSASPPGALPLTDADKVQIRKFLEQRSSLAPVQRGQLATQLASEMHKRIGGEPPSAPELYLEQLAATGDLFPHPNSGTV